VLAALHDRERTGTGRWVQTSLLESIIAMMDFQAARYTVSGEVPGQAGNDHPLSVPMGCFASADGHLNVGAAGGRLLRRFCEVIGRPELPGDPRFATSALRSANRAQLNQIVGERLRTRTTAEWVEALNAVGVPSGPVYQMDEVFADPQVRHLEMTAPVTHPELGELSIVRNAVRMTGAPGTVREPSPEAGEHSGAVLAGLGYSAAEIGELRARDVV
jgi:crotonobetainyl-CoA:carnitine CoA-transferase CaiB-like acyl-CoA transferase